MRPRVTSVLMMAGGALVIALAVRGPALAQDSGGANAPQGQSSTLAFELAQLAETWIHGDDAQAAARLDAFARDNRLRGELPRWLASMRAALAISRGETAAALAALQPELDAARDPRPYLRAARLFLALGRGPEALSVVRQGRARDARSAALRRFEAGLLWLQGDFSGAVDIYVGLLADDSRESYPYVAPEFSDWRNVKPWGGPEKPPAAGENADADEWDRAPALTEWAREPFADLFEPSTWYGTDLPGLERCVAEMAAEPEQLARQRAAFTNLLGAAQQAQVAQESYRGDDAAVRAALVASARSSRWRALVAARVSILADLAAGRAADAEAMAGMALPLAPEDLALLDLQARAMAQQGKAEEARTGPLARLAARGLAVYPGMLYAAGPQQQAVQRVLEPALVLYRSNPEAGLQQLEAVRGAFGPEHLKRQVPPDLIGVWLLQRGEKVLAQKFLAEAGRLGGYESGKSLAPDGVVLEHALLGLRVPVGGGTADNAGADGEARPEENDKEVEPAPGEPAPGPAPGAAASDPLPLRVLPRAGVLLGSLPDARAVVWRIAGVDFWGGSWGAANHLRAAQVLPDGEKNLRELLYGYHVRLAAELTPAQIDAALAETHPSSVTLAEALKSFAEGLQQAKGGSNWRLTQSLRERAAFLLGMVESRALLLRARMRQEPPRSLADLAAWLKTRQGMIDLRSQFKAGSNEAADRLAEERTAAKVPEVTHSGLLLDAAKALARAGNHAGAAQLLWFNRDVPIGIDSRSRRLFLAALMARKAGDFVLEMRCRLGAAEADSESREQLDSALLLLEFGQLKGELEEFGTRQDLEAYVEASIAPWADSRAVAAVFQAAPELRGSRATMLMRNSLRGGLDGIFRNALVEGSVVTIERNWLKMIAPRESHDRCRRFALWVLACDLPFFRGRGYSSGLNTATDTIRGWGMLAQLAEARAAWDPAARPEAERLRTLIRRCSTPAEDDDSYEEEWWD